MKVVINFMFNGIADEATVNDGIGIVYFFMTSFVIRFISCTTRLCQNTIHCYLLFVFMFIIRVV
jgi:hypothetical protein